MAGKRNPWRAALLLTLLLLGCETERLGQGPTGLFSPGQRVSVVMPSGCASDKANFEIMARAMISQDRAVLLPLVEQGRVLLLDGTVRAVVVSVDPTGHRTFIKIESGDHFNVAGKTCEILTEQLQAY